MKIQILIAATALSAVAINLSGCKKEETGPTAVEATKPSDTTAIEPAKVADPAKQSVAKEAIDDAANQANAATAQSQSLIDKAKAYIYDQKYQDALTTLSQLSASKLTADQQKLVDALKAEIQSAMAKASTGDAASALGGALGGKK